MKDRFFKVVFAAAVLISISLASCSNDNGSGNAGNKDNDNRGNHATEPRLPSDAEYPGSKLNDSLHKSDSSYNH